MRITSVDAREIFDSRGFPTVEASVTLEGGAMGTASVPSGASTGSHEACELRDGGPRLMGKGVTRAVEGVRGEIAALLRGRDPLNQRAIDEDMCRLDGTENLERLGANAILAVSMACARAAANHMGIELYRYLGGLSGAGLTLPMMNVINGGAHAGNNVDIQEFMLVPVGADSFSRAMRMCAEAYHALKGLLREKRLSTAVGDEGGFAPDIESDEEALILMEEAVYRAGMMPGRDVSFALDVAASGWLEEDGTYFLPKRAARMDRKALMEYLAQLAARHPIISIEDPLAEDDFEGFGLFREMLDGVSIVGDDLFVTNRERVLRGISENSATAVLIKPNQAGTITRTLDTIDAARRGGLDVIVSHRSGETGSAFIADLAAAVGARFIKSGAPARSERLAKYNRLLEIEIQAHS
jgi:enolase